MGKILLMDDMGVWLILLLLVTRVAGMSFIQPKFCPSATWNDTAITFAGGNMVGYHPYAVYVNTQNSVYITNRGYGLVKIWREGNLTPAITFPVSRSPAWSLLVTITDDLYIDNNGTGIDQWALNSSSKISTLYAGGTCYDLFLDLNESLYCVLNAFHKVIRRSLNNADNRTDVVAGTGCPGIAQDMLHSPMGTFVDTDYNLYVADSSNNRIQLFYFGELNGITIAGRAAPGTIILKFPTDIVLDGNGYLFIVDGDNHRIIRSSPTGFLCIAACSGSGGSQLDQLYFPSVMAFDSYGNIFVTDTSNNRTQKFLLATNFCDATTVSQQPSTSATNKATTNAAPAAQYQPISYNRPRFCGVPSWNSNGTTFANNSTIGANPSSLFISTNNTLYAVANTLNRVQVWYEGNMNPISIVSARFTRSYSIFVTNRGDMFIDNGFLYGQVDQLAINPTSITSAMSLTKACYGLFIDTNNTLYCSLTMLHQVVSRSLNNALTALKGVAGTGCAGSASNMLSSPVGIFVDINFDLYVADLNNNRIQRFPPGQSNAITVAGSSAFGTITLYRPTSVVMDADGYLFIVDRGNYRIVGSGPSGFRCLVGCSNTNGSNSNQLSSPYAMAFDSYGNILVTDTSNNRIQKFSLKTDLCDPTTTSAIQTTDSETSTQTAEEQSTSISTSSEPLSSTVDATTAIPSNQTCFSPVITLMCNASSLSSPLEFERSEDFFISSQLQLNCDQSLSTISQWEIDSCTVNCSSSVQIDQAVVTTSNELFIPARTLPYGTYQLKLSVSMMIAPHLTSSVYVYVKIMSSAITPNLIQYGTSMITHGYQQDLVLDPGTFSVDPDDEIFDADNWNYDYYCRIYGRYDFPSLGLSYLTIDDPTVDPLNPSCLSNQSANETALQYGGTNNSIKSSLTILANSLMPNQTYQFMIRMKNRQNPSIQVEGFLLVQVIETPSQLVLVACVIATLCSPNREYHYVNPKTQVALFSVCTGSCSSIINITWNIYYGVMNSSSNMVQWTPFNQTNQYQNIWFFGLNTGNLTSESSLFAANPLIEYWRFEVVYSFPTETSSSALDLMISESPENGSCSISPQNGTTSTLFTVSCINWQDQHGIQDYSIHSWTTDRTDRTMLAFSSNPTVQLRLPAGTDNRSLVNTIVSIRNKLGCITEFNLSSVIVTSDSDRIMNLVKILQTQNNQINKNPLARLLANGNQNNINQIVLSLSQRFNQINQQTIHNALANGIPAVDISVSTLNSPISSSTATTINASALIEYNKRLNTYARVRDYMITSTLNLLIATPNSVKLQSFSLAQLTQATNQLTRTTSMLASVKCYQLAVALYSMAKKISFEDVQTSATQIAECANNALNAINGPLQKRTTTLDLDSSRANTFPNDYDTDLELEWANIKLFVDGNEFSWENIEKGRNTYYQRQVANKISAQTTETIELLTAALHIHLNINQSLRINTSSTFMSLETSSIESLAKKSIKQSGDAHIQLPTHFQLNTTNHTAITIRSTVRSLASFGDARTQPTTNLSRSVSLTLVDPDGKEILIRADTNDPIKLLIPRDPSMIIPSMTSQNVTTIAMPLNHLFNLHFVDIRNALPISVHFEISPQKINLGYLLIYRFDRSPVLNSVTKEINGWTLLCPSNLNSDGIYTYFIDNQKTAGHQSVIFGIRELDSMEIDDACSNSSMSDLPITNQRVNFTADYDLRVYTSGCYYLDENNNWQADGLVVGPSTNHHETECYSTHLTTFAGGFLVLPAPINWNYVFANADFNKNKTVYITLICVGSLYLLLVIYARYKDKKDVEKLGVTPLPDNHRSDQYFYQILVFTGHRKDAGTKSKVHLVVSGDDDETQVRTLTDPKRAVLQRGGIDAFVMTVPKSLGSLNFIHIWHDNSGRGASASWFLKYIIVRDLQTMEKTYFICQKWFAVEKGDGVIERVLPAAGEYQKREFSYVLSKQAYHSISEGHLWFSIFSRPPSNRFTRVQRCTCCFVLLLTAMLLNILYYDQAADAKNNNKAGGSLALGPLYITPEQISIGVVVEILSFLPSILLVQFFRRIRPRHSLQKLSPLREAIYQAKQKPLREMTPVEPKKKKGLSFTFPWWCLFIAYGISLIFAAISMFFIIARGIEFGDLKTQKWLASLLSGFFSSILLIQPLKVLILAIVFAFFCRNTDKDREAEEFIGEDHPALDSDEEYLHPNERESPFAHRSRRPINRLDRAEVVWARDQRIQEIEMWNILREIFRYTTFLALLYFVAYSNINQQAFHQVRHLQRMFLNTRQPNSDYTKISTIEEYWSWLNSSFIPNLRAQKWYNDELPRNLSGYIADRSNRMIGWAIMRQVRVQSDACRIENIVRQYFNHCDADYTFSNQEKRSFTLKWINQTTQISNSSIDQAFAYQSDKVLDSYINIGRYNTYDSGGYVYQFRGRLSSLYGNISELHQLQWIDSRTRAVIIELTLYNPNSELFSAITFLTEFLPTGGVQTNARIEPVSFQIFRSLPQVICFILYMIFIIYMMVIEIQSIIRSKWKYFTHFWSMINVGIIICSWTTVGIYIWRYEESNRIGDLFASTNGYAYINLQLAVYVSDLYIYLLGFCCFFGTIQFLHLFRFNHRILFFMRTLQHASRDLIGFALMFSVVFMAFVGLFHLLFVSELWSCSSLLLTAGMLMEMMLMKFNTTEISAAAAFLGPFCFTLFIFIVVFVCLSMFLTIINDSFRSVRDNSKIQSAKDPQILAFMLYKLQRWIGLGKANELQQMIERDEQMRTKYLDPIEQFPEKIDQLLEALNRIYMDQQTHKTKK